MYQPSTWTKYTTVKRFKERTDLRREQLADGHDPEGVTDKHGDNSGQREQARSVQEPGVQTQTTKLANNPK